MVWCGVYGEKNGIVLYSLWCGVRYSVVQYMVWCMAWYGVKYSVVQSIVWYKIWCVVGIV